MYGWMHSDAVVLQVQPEAEDLGAVLLGKLEQLGSHWAAAFTSYDVLAFYNTQVSQGQRQKVVGAGGAALSRTCWGPVTTPNRCSKHFAPAHPPPPAQAVLEMPWDEHLLQNYIADCDAHNRWRLANFTAGPLEGLDPHMHMVHLAAAPSKRCGTHGAGAGAMAECTCGLHMHAHTPTVHATAAAPLCPPPCPTRAAGGTSCPTGSAGTCTPP